jgi:hypothetical protein
MWQEMQTVKKGMAGKQPDCSPERLITFASAFNIPGLQTARLLWIYDANNK